MRRAMFGTIRFNSIPNPSDCGNDSEGASESARPAFMVGLDVFIDIKNGRDVVKTRSSVVGWVPEEFVLLTAPASSHHLLDIQPGQPVVMRYLLDGVVYGFSANLVRQISSPRHLWAVQYPRTIEWKCLRQHARLQAMIPAFIADAEREQEALILDISEGGALLSLHEGAEPIPMDGTVTLRFQLPDGRNVEGIEARVRNLQMSAKIGQLGVQFTPEGEAFENLAAFVRENPQNAGLSEQELVDDF